MPGVSDLTTRYARSALALLHPSRTSSPFERLRTLCRRVLAAVSLGDRAGTSRLLAQITTLLKDDDAQWAAVSPEPGSRDRMAAELYLPFWAATQLDDHHLALHFAELMRTFENPSSRTAIAERLTVRTQRVFAGVQQGEPELPGMGHTDPLQLLEDGQDTEAAELISAFAARKGNVTSRSTADALVLWLQALLMPQTLTSAQIHATVARSRAFWSDGQPSTFVTFAAVIGFLSKGEHAAANRLVANVQASDWFTQTSRAYIALVARRPQVAMPALQDVAAASSLPRAQAITGVLTCLSHARLGHTDAATEHLVATWSRSTPRLLRFAFRMLADDGFATIAEWQPRLSAGLADVVQAANDDFRPLRQGLMVDLTRIERELLALLRQGMTNSQIAAHRFVSVNTVRTQLRHLMRKLDVSNRSAAVAYAEEFGLFDGPLFN